MSLISIEAEATVKRGEFTSSGEYIMHHQRNDHKGNGGYKGYQPYKYHPYEPYGLD